MARSPVGAPNIGQERMLRTRSNFRIVARVTRKGLYVAVKSTLERFADAFVADYDHVMALSICYDHDAMAASSRFTNHETYIYQSLICS